MRVQLINHFHDLIEMKEVWNRLLVESSSNFPFLTMEWQSSWWKAFGQEKELFVLAAYEKTSQIPSGIAPFMIRNSAGFKIMEFIGTGNSDYLDFIIREKNEETIHSFFAFLNSRRSFWDLIYIKDVLCGSENIPYLLKEAKSLGWLVFKSPAAIYPYIDITGDWQEFLSTKSSNFRYTLKKYERFLKKEEPGLRIEQKTGIDSGSRVLNDLINIEKRSWKAATRAARLQSAQSRNFYSDFLRQFTLSGWLNLWIGYIRNSPVAYLINFDYNNKIWFYNSAYDKEFDQIGIGSIVNYLAIKDAFFRGKKEYDFLKGREIFKSRWASDLRESVQLLFLKKSPRSLLGYIVVFQIRNVLKKLKRPRNLFSLFRRLKLQ